MKKTYLLLLALGGALAAPAQTLHGNVEVEGKYAPEVIVLDRIGVLPEPVEFRQETSPLDYSLQGVEADYKPGYLPIEAMGWRDTRRVYNHRGYLDLGLGSWLNSEVSAGFRMIDTRKTTLGAFLQFNSSTLYRPTVNALGEDLGHDASRRQFYDGTFGLYTSHLFDGKGILGASLSYRGAWFNYYGDTSTASAPTQTLTDVNARVSFDSPVNKQGFTFHAALAARHFAFRALYLPLADGSLRTLKGTRETNIIAEGGVNHPWRGGSNLGMTATLNALLYNKDGILTPDLLAGTTAGAYDISPRYGNLRLIPYYRFRKGLLNVKIGAEVDLTFDAGYKGNRFAAFHIAPDLHFDWRLKRVGLFFHLTGGTQLQTLAASEGEDYYCIPALTNTRPVYAPVDGKLGALIGPFSGFSFGAHVSYKVTRGVNEGGWYTFLLDRRSDAALPGFFTDGKAHPGALAFYGTGIEGFNIKGWSLGLNLHYERGTLFQISASGTYQQQKGETGYYNGLDRPKWVITAEAQTNPWRTLKLKLGFDYRGQRAIYTRVWEPGATTSQVLGLDLGDVALLNLGASYEFSRGVSIWGELRNLLNRKEPYLPGMAREGLNFMLGMSVKF